MNLKIIIAILQLVFALPVRDATTGLSRSRRFGHSQWRSLQSRRHTADAHRRLLNGSKQKHRSGHKIIGNLMNGFRVQSVKGSRQNLPGQFNIYGRRRN